MSTSLQVPSLQESPPTDGGVWYQLHSEREEICGSLIREPWPSNQVRAVLGGTDNTNKLQQRLQLIDDALDRLMAGSYGNCIVCRRRIEDDKLLTDPALPFCCACERKSTNQHQLPKLKVNIEVLLRTIDEQRK